MCAECCMAVNSSIPATNCFNLSHHRSLHFDASLETKESDASSES
jgi:hypothetical protein